VHTFEETPPISSYLYHMSAGEYVQLKNDDPKSPVPMNIFIRHSKKQNVDAHEIFRIVMEGMKFY
jgi:aminopeptidase N